MAEITLGAIIGPFTIVEALPAGHGGMARVFIATVSVSAALRAAGATPAAQLSAGNVDALPEKVALKIARVITPGESAASEQAVYFEALNNEVETLKRLRHPNIVRLYPIPRGLPRNPYAARATELDGNPWFCAMEYLGGGSLESRIKALGALPLAEAMEIAYQVGLALDHVHTKGMAHLDVKPENVLLRWPLGIGREVPLRRIQPLPELRNLGDEVFGGLAHLEGAIEANGQVRQQPRGRLREAGGMFAWAGVSEGGMEGGH